MTLRHDEAHRGRMMALGGFIVVIPGLPPRLTSTALCIPAIWCLEMSSTLLVKWVTLSVKAV